MGKPELGFYRQVLDYINLFGNHVVFIDDKEEHVHAARALGTRGFIFGDSTVRTFRETFDSPIGELEIPIPNTRHCDPVTNSRVSFADNFVKLLIIDTLQEISKQDPDCSNGFRVRPVTDIMWIESWSALVGDPERFGIYLPVRNSSRH